MSDWTPVVDLVEKLNALARDWDKVADRRACAGELRDVLANRYDPRGTAPSNPDHTDCQHRHGAYGECPVIPTFEVDPAECEGGRWNPDNGQCLDCGEMTIAPNPPEAPNA